MAGSLQEAKLTTRNARAALAPGLYWRQLDADLHLGYRKAAKGGRWLVRWYIGDGNYHRAVIGIADDQVSEGNWSYDEAVREARAFVVAKRARAAREALVPADTVRTIVESYIDMRNARQNTYNPGGRKGSDAASRLTRYVLADELADTALADLTEDALCSWKGRLGPHLKASSQVRTISDFKAALNLAHKRLRKSLPPDFGESVRFGLGRDEVTQYGSNNAREDQILPDDTVRDIIDAAAAFDEDGDVGRIVLVLAATGARFSQVQRIRVGDVQSDRLRIFVPTSRKGRGKTDGHYPVQVGEDVIDRLRPVMASRKNDEPLLCRWRLVQVKASEWLKDRRGPWTSASEMTRQWKAICKSLDLGSDVVPYALRHSSIVRGIRSGLPIRLVAAMHDTSVAMIERHYARYIVDGLEDLAAKVVVTLVRSKTRLVAD